MSRTSMGGDGHQASAKNQTAIWDRFEVVGVVMFKGKMVA